MAQAELLEQRHRHAPGGQRAGGRGPEQARPDDHHLDPLHGRDDSRPAGPGPCRAAAVGASGRQVNNVGLSSFQALAEAEP